MRSELQELIDKLAATQSHLRDLRDRIDGNESRPSAEEINAELTQIEAEVLAISVRFEGLLTEKVAGDRTAGAVAVVETPAPAPLAPEEVAARHPIRARRRNS